MENGKNDTVYGHVIQTNEEIVFDAPIFRLLLWGGFAFHYTEQ